MNVVQHKRASHRFVMPAKAGIPFGFSLERGWGRQSWKSVTGFISYAINLMERFIRALQVIFPVAPSNIRTDLLTDLQKHTGLKSWFLAKNIRPLLKLSRVKSGLRSGTVVGKYNLSRQSTRRGVICTMNCHKTGNGMPAFAGMTKR